MTTVQPAKHCAPAFAVGTTFGPAAFFGVRFFFGVAPFFFGVATFFFFGLGAFAFGACTVFGAGGATSTFAAAGTGAAVTFRRFCGDAVSPPVTESPPAAVFCSRRFVDGAAAGAASTFDTAAFGFGFGAPPPKNDRISMGDVRNQ
jgi:hypothetical protein